MRLTGAADKYVTQQQSKGNESRKGNESPGLLVANRVDIQPGQQIMPDDERKSAIPLGLFDLLLKNRSVGSSAVIIRRPSQGTLCLGPGSRPRFKFPSAPV